MKYANFLLILSMCSFFLMGYAQAKNKHISFLNWTNYGDHEGDVALTAYCIDSDGNEGTKVELPAVGGDDDNWEDGKHECRGEKLRLVAPPGSGFHLFSRFVPIGIREVHDSVDIELEEGVDIGGNFNCKYYSAAVQFMPKGRYDQPSWVTHPNITEDNPAREDGYYNVYQGCGKWW